MSIAIVGAGAIGGYLGVRLAEAGEDVTFIARSNAAAIAKDGLRLIEEDGRAIHAKSVKATRSMEEAGRHDIVLLTVKAHQVGPIAADLKHLIGPETVVVTMQNGIPWWYFMGGHGGQYEGTQLETADPGGLIAQHLDPRQVIGSVVYPAAVLTDPGTVTVIEGNRFGLGELDGSKSERALNLSQRLNKAGFKAPVTNDIRAEIWLKLWGNLSFNPISALSHATLEDICRFPDTRALAVEMMKEAEKIANALGVVFRIGIDKRVAGAEKVGAHKTSMLQDVEAGRPIELEALVGSVIELGKLVGVPTPHIDTVYALMRLLARSLETANGRLAIAKS
ncbi:2-dehydropantoate 2-reductase [Methylobacterium gnaphalii]|uniref:2-dehydropantoate 2-reductase n=1 Tax=Methylobacterium gnaphalii TaxID=1010610 RepID=A0A512JPP1_9HYPH|nr:2-dehydropantoate 2-reductase [Methylobacterium gnaphalii]GEP11909.1 2-dehydropantoate 2-reductase [Methylobacterium gnaphalii]GJD68471.1 2-dehydropantoate 2-reductase [Methylobacterium gnaphalii]GLS51496.1 2-dehydropantoate 2-reductase [Methylobacterium gnaphalii]